MVMKSNGVIEKNEKKEKRKERTLNLKERGGRMTVPFFWRTLPMLLPAVAANVKQIDSHIARSLALCFVYCTDLFGALRLVWFWHKS